LSMLIYRPETWHVKNTRHISTTEWKREHRENFRIITI
jgi:hypothetical protein